jgi:hypothetical protein
MRTFDAPMEVILKIKVVPHIDGAEINVTTLNNVDRVSSHLSGNSYV